MTSSEATVRNRAESVIREMMLCLEEDYLQEHIDAPIDQAAARFRCPGAHPVSQDHFHRVLGRFMGHLYRHGPPSPVRLTPVQACNEAIALLEQAYEGTCANGYFAALVEARCEPAGGLEVVLSRLAEAFKAGQRANYVRWVLRRCLNPADWDLRCEIAGILLDQLGPWLPEAIARRSADQFADDIPSLMASVLNIDQQMGRTSRGLNFTSG